MTLPIIYYVSITHIETSILLLCFFFTFSSDEDPIYGLENYSDDPNRSPGEGSFESETDENEERRIDVETSQRLPTTNCEKLIEKFLTIHLNHIRT